MNNYRKTWLAAFLGSALFITGPWAAQVYGSELTPDVQSRSNTSTEEHHHHGEHHRSGKGHGGWNRHLNEKVARLLNISSQQLEAELSKGKSLADIAKEKGIGEEQLIEKLKNEMTSDLKRLINRKGPVTFDRKPASPHEAVLPSTK